MSNLQFIIVIIVSFGLSFSLCWVYTDSVRNKRGLNVLGKKYPIEKAGYIVGSLWIGSGIFIAILFGYEFYEAWFT